MMASEQTPLTSFPSGSSHENGDPSKPSRGGAQLRRDNDLWATFLSALFGVAVGAIMMMIVIGQQSSLPGTAVTTDLSLSMLGSKHSDDSHHHNHAKDEHAKAEHEHAHGGHASSVKRTGIDPVSWGEDMASFHQGEVISGAKRVLRTSGQAAIKAADLTVIAPDDMRGQMHVTLSGIDAILEGAKMKRKNIVKVVMYTTNITNLVEVYDVYKTWIDESGEMPPCTAVQVAALICPELKIEIDVEAAD